MKRILIVEDEQDIQELLEAYLGDAGYETATAWDGIEAVSLFQQEAFDLVLLDVMLPKLDGFGVCEPIRRQSRVPIVLLTALDGEAEQLRGFDLEIDDYITKPFSMPILLRKLAAVLRRAGGDAPGRCLRYRGLTLDPDAAEVRLSSSPPGSLSCCGSSCPAPGGCLPGKFCWPSCGATTFSGTSGWWTATSRTSAKSWGWTTLRL